MEISEWTVLHEAFDTADDAPRFNNKQAADKFTAKFGGVTVGLANVTVINVADDQPAAAVRARYVEPGFTAAMLADIPDDEEF